MLGSVEFGYAWVLWFLLAIPLLVVWYIYRNKKRTANITFSNIGIFDGIKPSMKVRLIHSLFVLRCLALALIIVALARPQSSTSRSQENIEGIDIIMALDVSTSMLAEDFKPNRLEAAKSVAMEFIEGRKNDRVGLVIFAGESFTQCPLTTDHVVLNNLFQEVKTGVLEDGTAIGDGLATAVNRLKDSKAISKTIILLTDGENNSGVIDPMLAAEIAKAMGIRVYSIGVGTIGTAPYPIPTPFGIQYQNIEVKIDEKLMQEIASATGGAYFRATDNRKLKSIYAEIDKLEKSKIDVTTFHRKHELFVPFAVWALMLLCLEFLLRKLYFKMLP